MSFLAALLAVLAVPASSADAESDEASARSFGQYLVDRVVARHPELIGLDLHVPSGSESVIIASKDREHLGRKIALADKPVVAIDPATGQRIAVDLPLKDKSGKTIGAMRAVYAYAQGEDEARFVSQAQALGGEMRRQIPTVAQLVQPLRPVGGDIGGPQTLPTTREVVSGKTLAENEQEGYAEAVKNVAGVAPANSKGSANDSIYIRGIKLNLFSNYRINGGLPVAGVITMPNEDKARLETLKGANALQFGVASPAGIINMITKRAGENDVASISTAGSSFGQYGATFDVGHRLGDDQEFGVRVNGSATQLQNGVRGLDGDGEFVSSGLDYRASDRLSLQGDFEYYRKHVPEQAGISLLDPVNGQIPITPVPDPRNLLSGPWAVYTPETTNAQVRADYRVRDDVKLSAEVGRSYSDRSRFSTRIGGYDLASGAGGTVRVATVTQDYRNSFGMLELQSAFSTWMLAHELTVGASITDRRAQTTANRKEFILKQQQNIDDPVPLTGPVFTGVPTSLPLSISRDGGGYFYDTISFDPRAPRLLIGMRYTEDYENNGKTFDPVSCVKCGPSTTWLLLPAFGALWDVVPGLTLFGSYMEGLEAGGTGPTNAYNANEILPSQVSSQREVGVRTSYFRFFTASISLFDINKANPVTDPNPNAACGGNPMCFVNSGQINYRGLETTLSAELSRMFTLDAGWQWLRAIQNSPDPKFNGFAPENTPKGIGNVRLGFRAPWVRGLTLNAGLSGVTSRYVNFQQQGSIPGYVLYSAGASWVVTSDLINLRRLTFLLNLDNLTNLRYWNSVQTGTYGIGMDRTIKMTMKMDI